KFKHFHCGQKNPNSRSMGIRAIHSRHKFVMLILILAFKRDSVPSFHLTFSFLTINLVLPICITKMPPPNHYDMVIYPSASSNVSQSSSHFSSIFSFSLDNCCNNSKSFSWNNFSSNVIIFFSREVNSSFIFLFSLLPSFLLFSFYFFFLF